MFYNNLPGKWGAKQNVTYRLYCRRDPLQQGGICRIDRRLIISIVGYQSFEHSQVVAIQDLGFLLWFKNVIVGVSLCFELLFWHGFSSKSFNP